MSQSNSLGRNAHGCFVANTADSVAIDRLDSAPAFFTPPGVPRVLDDDVVCAIADSKDCMVDGREAGRVRHDATSVVRKLVVFCIHSDVGRAQVDRGLHGRDRSCGALDPGISSDIARFHVVFAGSKFSREGVVAVLQLLVVVSGVGPGRSGIASFAAIRGAAPVAVQLGAVDNLLLGEVRQLGMLDEIGALKTSGGGESPATSTGILVGDLCDSTLVSPVPGRGNGKVQHMGVSEIGLAGAIDESRLLFLFFSNVAKHLVFFCVGHS